MMEEKDFRREIVENLDRAVEEGWIQVYYQPIVRSISGKVCNVEALARWNDPERGMLLPGEFIPILEEARLIHKLDMAVVKRVLKDFQDLRLKDAMDNRKVPVSVNFSRADFDAFDLVQELCRLTDDAGVDRNMINVEITESMVGSDFDYMKEQVERFRAQGFQVWMDDFGSGYSSLDVLQSITFDLIKFDRNFITRLDKNDRGRIILTELVKMANSLGLDTVCEGVETEDQVRFLQEIGCDKLQGFYFMKPALPDRIIRKYTEEIPDGFEDSRGAAYYDTMGRFDLYDLSFLASIDDNILKNTFDTIPVGLMELDREGGYARYIRSNQSLRDFMKRTFGFDLSNTDTRYPIPKEEEAAAFMKAVIRLKETGMRAFVDEVLKDGSTVRSFIREIGKNDVNGKEAIAVAVLSITPKDESFTYQAIAMSLAADYYNIYVIDLDTDEYREYTSAVGGDELSDRRQGVDFFASAREETMTRIYEEDREAFLQLFTKENVLKDIDNQGVFTTTYRLIDTGTPMYVNMKVTRMQGGNRLILGISIIDSHMRQLEEERKLRQERAALGRIAALSPSFIVLYTVDPETGHYTQYNPSKEFTSFGLALQGQDFFGDVVLDAPKAIHPDDMERHLRVLTKENMLSEIKKNGFFTHDYHLLMNGESVPVRLKATMVEEDGRESILLGVVNDENEEYRLRLEEDYKKAKNSLIIYSHIAHALARGYTDLYYVNMATDELIEFHTDDEHGVLSELRRGEDFFEGCLRDVKLFVHPEDQETFVQAMNRDFLERTLTNGRVFEMTYRRIKAGVTFWVKMTVTRMKDDPNMIVIAVSDIDELVRQREARK